MKRLSLFIFLLLASLASAQPISVQDAKAKPMGGDDPAQYGRGYILPSKQVRDKLHYEAYQRHGYRMHAHVQAMTAPATFDSRTMGWIPPIRNQASCGDCFGVSGSDALTIAFIKGGYQKADGSFIISEQFGLDCGGYPGGCGGGDGPQVYAIMKSKGFPASSYLDVSGKSISDYPSYTARPSSCRLKSGAKMWKCTDWGYVTADQSDRAPTVDEIKAGVMQYANVTFAFDANALNNYNGKPITRLGNSIDHEITGFVGWDDNKACPDGSKGAFICRNQWGESFGDGGYFWLAYTAVPAIVEACWMTVAVLPPPPAPPPNPPTPPPQPPGPVPPPGPSPTPKSPVQITLLPDGTYKITGGMIVTRDMTLGDIIEGAKKMDALTLPPIKPPSIDKPVVEPKQSMESYPHPWNQPWYAAMSSSERVDYWERIGRKASEIAHASKP